MPKTYDSGEDGSHKSGKDAHATKPESSAHQAANSAIGQYSFNDVEQSVLAFWRKHDTYQKAKEHSKKGQTYYFLDGPPYTSGKVHLGTAWNKSLKDCFLRYKRMNGVNVWDRAGYDMHGLPTEHATEKKLGLNGKKDIERFGVARFISECKSLCVENMRIMNKDFERLGIWMDFENAYQSITDSFIEGVWWLIRKAHDNGRFYEGKRTMQWCASCASSLAKHELEYKEITDTSIFVKFRISGTENEYLIVWTTTPWTLAFNLAVMVNPDIDYLKCEVDGEEGKERWIVAKVLSAPVIQAVADKEFKVIEQIKGDKLKGLKYIHPWIGQIPSLAEVSKEFPKAHIVVLSSEYVDVSAGSGLVHCAPGCGPEDYEVGHREGLPAFNIIDEQGIFPKEMGVFAGLRAKKDDLKFVESLSDKRVLVAKTPVRHEYAHCWRCKSPVVFRTTTQWFFRIEDLKENMRELNKEIAWNPEWAGSRQFDSWLDNLRDNSVTKQRYWGVPLPVWRCDKCGKYDVIGSIAELEEAAGSRPKDLHKPVIDGVTFSCKCGGVKKRIPDVLDVWVDAGCTAWTCLDFPQQKQLFEQMFPADFILEGKDQIRGWFNLLFVASMVSMNKPSFKSVYMHGFVLDSQGRKMSKSLGNYILPEEVISQYGADTFRYFAIGGAQPGLDLSYNPEDVKLKFKNLAVLWNLHKYLIELHAQGSHLVSNDNPSVCLKSSVKETAGMKSSTTGKGKSGAKKNLKPGKKTGKAGAAASKALAAFSIEERYILSLAQSTILRATEAFEAKKINEIPSIVEELFLELSRTYIQLVRDKSSLGSQEEKDAVFTTIFEVFRKVLVLFAPVAPFITEMMYQNLRKSLPNKDLEAFGIAEHSVHHVRWPISSERNLGFARDEILESQFAISKAAIQSILAVRDKIQLGVRWPLKEAIIVVPQKDKEVSAALEALQELIMVQTNVKRISIIPEMRNIKKRIRADYAKIGPAFGPDAPKVVAQFAITPPDIIYKKILDEGKFVTIIDGKRFTVTKDHLLITKELPEHLIEGEFRHGEIYINKERTPELEAEGFAREVMRRVQQQRKDAGLQKQDSIILTIAADEELASMLKAWKDKIVEKVGAKSLTISTKPPTEKRNFYKQEAVKGKKFELWFDKQ